MKTRLLLFIYALVSLLGLMVLLSTQNVFVVIALAVGFLLLGHRELWSLVRYRRLPVIDDRVRENLNGAMRITGVFFFISSIVLILLLSFDFLEDISTASVIGVDLVAVGLVYVIGYHYYDRVFPNLGERAVRWLKICLWGIGLSLSTIALSIALHNMVSTWFDFEEAFFFILAVIVCPVLLGFSLIGSLFIFLNGLWTSYRSGDLS